MIKYSSKYFIHLSLILFGVPEASPFWLTNGVIGPVESDSNCSFRVGTSSRVPKKLLMIKLLRARVLFQWMLWPESGHTKKELPPKFILFLKSTTYSA